MKKTSTFWQEHAGKFKTGGILLLVLILLLVISGFLQPLVTNVQKQIARTFPTMGISMDGAMDMEESYMLSEKAMAPGIGGGRDAGFAANIAPEPMTPTMGDDAEDFEVKSYNTTIETTNKEEVCGAFFALKAKDYIVFENANDDKRGCNYNFKVKNEYVEEVLTLIEKYDPKYFNESVYTIKKALENITSEAEILDAKIANIEQTLEDATAAFDSIAEFATENKDAESLSQVISNKINLVERLTNERINNSARLERLSRSKAEQLDRLIYTMFYVNIIEDKYFDGEELADAWKRAVQKFFADANTALQGISIGLVSFVLYVIQYVLYYLILFWVIKFGWKVSKKWWKKK